MTHMEFQIGDTIELSEPYLGCRWGEIVGEDGTRWIVRLSSGKEISVREDEIKGCY
ncbi:hypothetical protein FACS1894208_01800 [Clostridia bacterium]|nr:hypothetical protein FACS1894208_01800 [Clostridia bacterium]